MKRERGYRFKFPSKIVFSPDQTFPIRQIKGLKTLGYFDRSSGELAIRKDQPQTGKHVILIHEILHFVAEFLIQAKVIKRQPDEAFITEAAPILLNMLLGAGVYRGQITQEELFEFMEKQARQGPVTHRIECPGPNGEVEGSIPSGATISRAKRAVRR